MLNEWTGALIIDEIEYNISNKLIFFRLFLLFSSRLVVTYGKAKEYLSKITLAIDQQIGIWQNRRQVMDDQINEMKPSSAYDFFLPKTQRINELTLESVQGLIDIGWNFIRILVLALCRVDLLMEQIIRIDLKSRTIPLIPHHTSDSTPREPTASGKINGSIIAPIPVLRTPVPSGRSSTITTVTEKSGFEPVKSQSKESFSRSSSILPQNNNHYSGTDAFHSVRSPSLP